MPKDAAKEMNIIETILGINKETVQHVYADLVKPLKINSKMVMTLLHYARIIRPCQRECINEVLEMINKNFQINQTKIYIYIYDGIIKRMIDTITYPNFRDIKQTLISDDVETFTKRMRSLISRDIKDIKADSLFTFIENRETISVLQEACLYCVVKCFKRAFAEGDFDKEGLAKFAVAGGNMEIINFLKGKGVSFDNCFLVAVKFHRYDVCDMLINEYKCEDITPTDSINSFNYRTFFYPFIKKETIKKPGIDQALIAATLNEQKPLVVYLVKEQNADIEIAFKKKKNDTTSIVFNTKIIIIKK